MLTKVGIIYSLAQLQRRRLIISDVDDSHLDLHRTGMASGEGWIDCPLSIYNSFSDANGLDAWLATMIGDKTSHRCTVVAGDTNVVQCIIGADPIIDSHPAGIVIQDDVSMVGDIYDFEAQAPVVIQ